MVPFDEVPCDEVTCDELPPEVTTDDVLEVVALCDEVCAGLLSAGLELLGLEVIESVSTLIETLPQISSISLISDDETSEVVEPLLLLGAVTFDELSPEKSTSPLLLPQAAKNVSINAITAIIAMIFFKIIAPLFPNRIILL